MDVFIAPIIEGGDHANTPVRGSGCQAMSEAIRVGEVEITQVGGDVRLRGILGQAWRRLAGFQGA